MATLEKRILSGRDAMDACTSIESASWLWHPDLPGHHPAMLHFRIGLESDGTPLIIHVSADQRFLLKLDGNTLVRGPDCSDPAHWSFATYRITITPGQHQLTADVWCIGHHAPVSRMTIQGGFILKAEGSYHEQLTTGVAPWLVRTCPEYSFSRWNIAEYQSVGDQVTITGSLRNTGREAPAIPIAAAAHKPVHGLYYDKWLLCPTTLPDQLCIVRSCGSVRAVLDDCLSTRACIPEAALHHPQIHAWQDLVSKQIDLTIAANSRVSILCDLEDYCCAYPKIVMSGGNDALITWSWAEALYEKDLINKSDNRDRIAGLHFTGIEDCFISNGLIRQEYETHWWRSGRYMLLSFETGATPLIIHRMHIEETRYPLENESVFLCSEPGVNNLICICFRGMQTNSHDIAADSPYYEQMMYTGDTRVQALIHYVTSTDDRLPRRCIELFNWSRASGCHGLTTGRYPDRDHQWIPTFSLIWIWMVHDYLFWRDDKAFVAAQLVATRSILNTFSSYVDTNHLLRNVPFWTFVDWTSDWFEGYPPGAREGVSCLLNLLYILTLEKAMTLEESLGNKDQAVLYRNQRDRTTNAVIDTFWDHERGMFSDDDHHRCFSEHAQALAILCSAFDDKTKQCALSALTRGTDKLTKASIYFSFYVFSALVTLDDPEASKSLHGRLEPWMNLSRQGFKCPPEVFGHTRSDCHAWGSHPLYHVHASVLGVRPASPGFRTVSISPRDIGWKKISGSTIHPKGIIHSSFSFGANELTGEVVLPPETTGMLNWKGQSVILSSGTNTIRLPNESAAICAT